MKLGRFSLAACLAVSMLGSCEQKKEPPAEPAMAQTGETDPEEARETEKTQDESDKLSDGTDEQRVILARAKGHFLNNEFDAARKEFTHLVRTGPVSSPQVTAYIALGELHREDGDPQKALELYRELQKKAPELPEVHFMTARALAEEGETTAAVRAYENAIKLQPDYLQAYVELGALYSKAGREEEGQKIFLEYEKRVYSLAKTLEDPQATAEDQVHVLEVFSFIQDDRANAAILKSLSNPHPPVRERAVELAEEFKLGAATEKLTAMAVQDPHMRVRMAAKEAAESLTGAPVEGASPTFVDDARELPTEPEGAAPQEEK